LSTNLSVHEKHGDGMGWDAAAQWYKSVQDVDNLLEVLHQSSIRVDMWASLINIPERSFLMLVATWIKLGFLEKESFCR